VHVSATRGATHHIEDEALWRKDGSFLPAEYTLNRSLRIVEYPFGLKTGMNPYPMGNVAIQ